MLPTYFSPPPVMLYFLFDSNSRNLAVPVLFLSSHSSSITFPPSFFYMLNMPNPPEAITATKKADKNLPALSILFISSHQQSSQSPQLLFQRIFLLLFFCTRICKTDAVPADTIYRYVLSQNIQTHASVLA